MKLSDAVFGLLLLALGAAVIAVRFVLSDDCGAARRPCPFPGLIAIGLVIGGLILLVRGWRARATVPWLRFEPWVHSPRHVAGVLGVIGSIVFYIVAADWLGFFLTALIILTTCFRLFGVATRALDRDRGDCDVRHPFRVLQVAARAPAVGLVH